MNNFVKRNLKGLKKSVKSYLYDKAHRQEALQAYNVITTQHPSRRVSVPQKKQIIGYAKEVLGSEAFAPWLFVYTACQGKFKEGWIPDNYFGRVAMPIVNKTYSLISNVKTISSKILHTDFLPDIAYCLGGSWFNAAGTELSETEVPGLLFGVHPEVYIKPDFSNQGRNILIRNRDNFNPAELVALGDFVVQAPLRQHRWFDQIIAGSLTTLRITTLKKRAQKAQSIAANLRIGRSGNRYIMSKEALKISIVDDQGTLDEYASFPDWKTATSHPDSGFVFKGKILPHFKQAVEVCEKLHCQIPHFSVVGWDVAITSEEAIKIIEWNAWHPAIKFHEAMVGPCFKDMQWESLWKTRHFMPEDTF